MACLVRQLIWLRVCKLFHRQHVTETGEVFSHFAAEKRNLQRWFVVLDAALRLLMMFTLFIVCLEICDGDVDPVLWWLWRGTLPSLNPIAVLIPLASWMAVLFWLNLLLFFGFCWLPLADLLWPIRPDLLSSYGALKSSTTAIVRLTIVFVGLRVDAVELRELILAEALAELQFWGCFWVSP